MKIKVVIASAAIAFASQAHAATDTSCNPFAQGENCNGAVAFGVSNGSSFGKFMINHRSRGQSVSFAAKSASGDDQVGRIMRSLAESIDGGRTLVDEEVDFEEAERIDLDEVADEVAVVPVPAAGFLLLAGLGGLVAMRRKKS